MLWIAPYHQIGGALLLGRQARVGDARFEWTGGFGAEQFNELIYYQSTPDMSYRQDNTKARPYVRAGFAALFAVAPQVDVVAQLVGRVTVTDAQDAAAAAATVGLRLVLP